jgi:hypothetical protein
VGGAAAFVALFLPSRLLPLLVLHTLRLLPLLLRPLLLHLTFLLRALLHLPLL